MRRYCLYCFATLPGETHRCERCRQGTRRLDYRRHWNKNPRIRSIEQTIKVLTVVLTACLIFLFFTVVGPATTGRAGAFYQPSPRAPGATPATGRAVPGDSPTRRSARRSRPGTAACR